MLSKFLSKKLIQKRKELGLTQLDVAKAIGVNRAQIANIEGEKCGTSYEGLYKLCCLFNCSPSDFFPKIKKLKK